MRLRCDSCGALAPDVVAPILYGIHGWQEFTLDGTDEQRGAWTATVLLCDERGHGWRRTGMGCASRMATFVESGGRHGEGPLPPPIRSCRGGQRKEPTYA